MGIESIQIWVKEGNHDLDELRYQNITRYNIHNITENPKLNEGLINQDILQISKKSIEEKNNFVALHFRSGDELMKSNIDEVMKNGFWSSQFQKSYDFIENNSQSNVLVCSSNLRVVDHFCEKYNNVFSNNFSNPNIEMHRIYGYTDTKDDSIYIEHAKEIYAEMVSLKYAKKIFSVNHFSSNFVLYGILNNVNYNTWQEKLTHLVYADNI